MKKEENIQVVTVELDVDGLPKKKVIPNELSQYQDLVGGLIEVVEFYFDGGKVLCIINEEGKINGLKPNFAFPIQFNKKTYYDIIHGDVVFVGEDGMDFRGLTDEEIDEVLKIIRRGREILVDIVIKQLLEGAK